MIEFCTPKRMLVSIGAFLAISVLVIYWENSYTLEYDNNGYSSSRVHQELKTANAADSHKPIISKPGVVPPIVSSDIQHAASVCGEGEPFEILATCAPCSVFEMKAGHRDYCAPSGYYDKLNCTSTGKIAARPCLKVMWRDQRRFDVFAGAVATLSLVFTLLSSWRRDILDKKAYARILQQFGDNDPV